MRNRRKRPVIKTHKKLSELVAEKKAGERSSFQVSSEADDYKSQEKQVKEGELSPSLEFNVSRINKLLGNPTDLIIREFEFELEQKVTATLMYLEEMNDTQLLSEFILEPLMNLSSEKQSSPVPVGHALHYIKQNALALGKVQDVETEEELLEALLAGLSILLIEGNKKGLKLGTTGGKMRNIEEPASEVVIRGPREAFTESIKTNLSLIRRKVKSPDLRVERFEVGEITKTDLAIVYLENIVNPLIVKEIKERIEQVKTDGVLETGQLEEFIQDETVTVFPQVMSTERPDVVVGNLLEGRVGILVNGTPFSLIAPAQFIQFFQSSEDYYMRYDISTFLRILRFSVFIISLIAPSIYIALTTFHQAMIPTTLLFGIAAQREGVPFPAIAEALVMEITFEILREAGIRMPRAVGVAVSIVGALVLGQAAVQAGLVSPAMVIVVGITAVASFAIPSFAVATSARLLRFPLMIISSIFGFYGLTLGLIVIVAHLTSLRSFGVPYLSPFAPIQIQDLKDSLLRYPISHLFKRPVNLAKQNATRTDPYQVKKKREEETTR
ncbi:spore germination protein [Fictibacillus phosphorivorans]|uniref:spore germination protein n=1 Tax=Fictibacillus phosphorivorans TaxID=1221500 RepID=UPI00203B9DD6|nr:spore germination protein [Fictibacillus phosphorivorans]MCM3718574.1 spore germination protein [Fictibacillus phosphorivorans]MCM3776197.1 spore germination protein [Fictibacillus phosphorivorans]